MEVSCVKTFRSVKGKTVSVEVTVEDGKVKEVKITGDFFVTDDNEFEDFESSFKGKGCEEIKELKVPNVMVGASEEEIIRAVLQCLPCSD